MTNAPMLTLPDFSKSFVVETDACQEGIGAALMQEKKPITFFNQKLSVKNQGFSTYEK
jgi:RNase H-like domain found in reverse transcriptase